MPPLDACKTPPGGHNTEAMSKGPKLVDTTVDGPQSKLWMIQQSDVPELAAFRISRLGIHQTRPPFRRVRLRPEGSFILLCLAGEGSILLEGNWQKIRAGEVAMAPPRVLNAFHTPAGKTWTFAWIRYEEPTWVRPMVGAGTPLRLKTGADELGKIMGGLRDEWAGQRDPAVIHHWINLVQAHARRLTSMWQGNERLWRFWEEIESQLDSSWKLGSLAAKCHMSAEHLRRICHEELGRSPMEHLTFMRIQRAQEILEKTDEKIETVARMVGYASSGVFSRAFVRCVGIKPTEYRGRR